MSDKTHAHGDGESDRGVVPTKQPNKSGRSQHDALDALWVGIMRKKVNLILKLDVQAFFDKVDHAWMVKFVEHRIGDKRIVRLIQKWLKAGVMEQGRGFETKEGTPQGSVISPVLANLYLHYVLDLWMNQWRRRKARGEVITVRYADDAVLGFQYREDAERFLEQLEKENRRPLIFRRPGDRWHVDEVFLKINGRVHYLWRAVDQDSDALDILVQRRRDMKAGRSSFASC
jgi:hypothetical protein